MLGPRNRLWCLVLSVLVVNSFILVKLLMSFLWYQLQREKNIGLLQCAGSFIKGSDWMHDAIHCFNLIVIPSLTGHYHRLTISLSSIISMELHIDAFFYYNTKKYIELNYSWIYLRLPVVGMECFVLWLKWWGYSLDRNGLIS